MIERAQQASLGVVGLGTMGSNLALNVADHGFPVAVWNRNPAKAEELVAENPGLPLAAHRTLADLVRGLERPRKVLLMVPAGAPVDEMLTRLAGLCEEGDLLIDGGNTWFEDTQRRERELAARGLRFYGVGVSGGEEGARHGPSLMPGGEREGYALLAPILEAIAARTDSGPCVTYVGSDGAGHFVKTVHNGIEYADMQLIAEAYDVLRRALGFDAGRLAEVFSGWNRGPLESFLIEITGRIFGVRDPETGGPLVDRVLDRAGQKGTGRWTVQVALELGVPVPSIAAALDARLLSSRKDARTAASRRFPVAERPPLDEPGAWVERVHDALYAAKICAYAQGMDLIRAASEEHGWQIDLGELARIWKGGCIIRARFLDRIRAAYRDDPELSSLLLAEPFLGDLRRTLESLREVLALAQGRAIPVPALAASLAHVDASRTARLPQNLTQAQRDAFGAHTYQRVDDPDGEARHTDWLGGRPDADPS